MIEWRTVDPFPSYEVSDTGVVRNAKTGRELKTKINQYGVIGVGMMRHGIQFHRSVPLLVAQAFIRRPFPLFDTPINLDGDRYNNYVNNLVWRPRWHAIAYNRQFKEPYHEPITRKVQNLATRVVYRDSWEAAVTNGVLEKDIVLAIMNRTYVWPLYQEFGTL